MPILKGTEEPHDPVCFREDGLRLDGRKKDEGRPFSCEVGVIKNAQGSALVRHGGNQIYAAIYGPREVHPRHMAKQDRGILRVYYRMCTFSVHERKSPAPNRRENEISKVIREALEPVLFLEAYPDSQIEIYIEVVAADGGTRCASTTAASLALADAGIPMKSMLVGIAAGKVQDQVILDLGDKEDKVGQADVPAVVVMKDKSISLLQFDGEMSIDEMELAFKYILKGADAIYQKQLEALKGKYEKIQKEAELESKDIKKDLPVESTSETKKTESKEPTPEDKAPPVADAAADQEPKEE
jgi:exosome complex component RRP41